MMVSPRSIVPTRSATIASTTAAGTMIQTARGAASLATRSVGEAAPARALFLQIARFFAVTIPDDAGVPVAHQAPHHGRAHAPQTDHSEFHTSPHLWFRVGPHYIPALIGNPRAEPALRSVLSRL